MYANFHVFYRCNLSSVILQLLAMGITNVEQFDFMDKPSSEVSELSLHTYAQLIKLSLNLVFLAYYAYRFLFVSNKETLLSLDYVTAVDLWSDIIAME